MTKRIPYNEEFYGVYKEIFENYVFYKRSLGYKYGKSRIKKLQLLNKHVIEKFNPTEVIFTQEMTESFMALFKEKASQTYHNSECLLRQLGLFLVNQGYDNIYVYPESKVRVTTTFVPYIYSKEEIIKLFKATDELLETIKYNPDYRIFYQVLIRLLYSTGLRISEALNLKKEDVDLINDVLIINNGKNNVTRLVPFNLFLHEWLLRYKEYPVINNSDYFFKPIRARTRSQITIDSSFKKTLLPAANIPYKLDNTGPRIHDLRHTFACHSLDKMIKEGRDPYCALPYLSTYLGHKGIESTEKYLRLTEEHFNEITLATHEVYSSVKGDNNE